MARNQEKAMTLFNKWHTFKKDFHAGAQNRRPLVAGECQSLAEAEKARRGIVRDVTKKIAMIQNASLGEHRIRELNDEINKLMRTKHFWELKVRELGGGDMKTGRKQIYDVEGEELPGAPNYRYYGAAKQLPGVRELFAELDDAAEARRLQKTRGEIRRNITPDYYGFRDDDDGVLEAKEAETEKRRIAEAVAEYEAKKRRVLEDVQRSGGIYGKEELAHYLEDDEEEEQIDAVNLGRPTTVQAATTTSHENLQALVLEKKKLLMLEKYA